MKLLATGADSLAAATISALLSSVDLRKEGELCWKVGVCFEKLAPTLLLPEILWTGLSKEKAVAARPEARTRTLISLTILARFYLIWREMVREETMLNYGCIYWLELVQLKSDYFLFFMNLCSTQTGKTKTFRAFFGQLYIRSHLISNFEDSFFNFASFMSHSFLHSFINSKISHNVDNKSYSNIDYYNNYDNDDSSNCCNCYDFCIIWLCIIEYHSMEW